MSPRPRRDVDRVRRGRKVSAGRSSGTGPAPPARTVSVGAQATLFQACGDQRDSLPTPDVGSEQRSRRTTVEPVAIAAGQRVLTVSPEARFRIPLLSDVGYGARRRSDTPPTHTAPVKESPP